MHTRDMPCELIEVSAKTASCQIWKNYQYILEEGILKWLNGRCTPVHIHVYPL